MAMMQRFVKFAAAATLMAFTSLAAAVTYSNPSDAGYIEPFGAPDTTNYGQTFNLYQNSIVEDWSYFALEGTAGNLRLVIAEWDGNKAIGAELYTSSLFYGGGTQALSFSNINLGLSAGSYISYLTVSGVTDAASDMLISASSRNGYLGGEFRFLNTDLGDPLALGTTWDSTTIPTNMQFVANISIAPEVTPVPEPEIYAMMGLGLALLGWSERRRRGKPQAV